MGRRAGNEKENLTQYEVIRSRRKTVSIEIRGGRVIVRAPLRMPESEIQGFVEKHKRWIENHLAKAAVREKEKESVEKLSREEIVELAKKACEVIPKRVAYYAPLVGVTYGKITIRDQRTRWGSCSSKGNLNFNCLLMLAPPEVLDSVVVHELCHRKEMNHSEKFYREVLRVFPEYHKYNEWLKEKGPLLMARLP